MQYIYHVYSMYILPCHHVADNTKAVLAPGIPFICFQVVSLVKLFQSLSMLHLTSRHCKHSKRDAEI